MQWAGHRYGLQSLKPSVETVLVFQKPYEGKPVDSITETGAGALNIEQSRIRTDWSTDPTRRGWQGGNSKTIGVCNNFGCTGDRVAQPNNKGRWPANLTLTHHPECVQVGTRRVRGDNRSAPSQTNSGGIWSESTGHPAGSLYGDQTIPAWDCHELCAVREMGEMSGELKTGAVRMQVDNGAHQPINLGGGLTRARPSDKGTAARFFYNASWTHEQLEQSHCAICLQEPPKHSMMSETQLGGSLCDSASGAAKSSSQGGQNSDSVETPVVQAQPPKSGDRSGLSSLPVSNAEKPGETTQATTVNIAQDDVLIKDVEQLARCVKYAASLCDLCATAITQSCRARSY
jgi:hypothetical protein